MKTTQENISETIVKLTISLDKKELAAAEQVALKKLSKNIKVAGFRKGHVPLAVAAKNIDPNALAQQTLEDALSKSVAEAFMEKQIQVLDRPEVEIKKFVPGSELEFTAEAPIIPKVTLGDYKKLKAVQEKATVGTKEVDEIVDRVLTNFAEKKDVKRAAKMGDETIIDFVGKKDDEAFEGGTANDYNLTLGSNSFIPGFEEGIVGHKAGDKFELKLEFPKDYHADELKGQKVVFETTLKAVKEVVKPELTDEVAAKAGPFTSAKELREDIKKELTSQKERELGEKLKDDLVKQLVAKSKLSAPDVLVEDQVKSIEQDMQQNVAYSGLTIDKYIEQKGFKDHEDWVAKEVRPAAEDRVKAGLVLSELSKELKIEATADELAERINQYKQQYAQQAEMAKRFDEPEVQRDIANRLLTEKTIDKLVELNTSKKPSTKKPTTKK